MDLVDGCVVGTWKRILDRESVTIYTRLARRLSRVERDALRQTIAVYGRFLGLEARWRG